MMMMNRFCQTLQKCALIIPLKTSTYTHAYCLIDLKGDQRISVLLSVGSQPEVKGASFRHQLVLSCPVEKGRVRQMASLKRELINVKVLDLEENILLVAVN